VGEKRGKWDVRFQPKKELETLSDFGKMTENDPEKKRPAQKEAPGKEQTPWTSGPTPVATLGLTPLHLARALQSGSRPAQTSLPINGITTRAFPRPLLLTTLPRAFPCHILLTTQRDLDYSDDIVFLSHPPHFVYQLPAPPPDNAIIIAITVSVWIVLFM